MIVSKSEEIQSKISSTRKHLSKFKSFFKNINVESFKNDNFSSAKGIRPLVFQETRSFSNGEIIETTQPDNHLIIKDKSRPFFNVERKDEHIPMVEQQLHGRRRKETVNKIKYFFKKKIASVFQSFKKTDDVLGLDIKLYATACKNYKVRQQIKNLKETAFEIKQIKQYLLKKVEKYNSNFDPLELEYMELQSTEIDSLKTLLQKKRLEKRAQVNSLVELLYRLQYLGENIEEHENVLKVQKEEGDESREKILRERHLILRERERRNEKTELYKWQLDQIEKQRLRPKENERPILHFSKINPWTVRNDLLRDQSEQISSWQLRFNFLQRQKPSVTIWEIQSGEVPLSDVHPGTLRYAQEYAKKYYDMQLEIEQITQQQEQEKLQLERDTVEYMKAFWNTKSRQIAREIKESEVLQQLITFNNKVGVHASNLYHRII